MKIKRLSGTRILVFSLLIIAIVLAVITGSDLVKMARSGVSAHDDEPKMTETVSSSASPEATPTPEMISVDEGGSIYSPNNEKIGIRADWHLSNDTGSLVLDIDVYLVCYSIDIPPCDGVIRVCGKEYPFTSGEVSFFDDNYKHDTLIYSTVIPVDGKTGETIAVPLTVSWFYNANYGSNFYGTISADTSITVSM